MGGRGGSPSPSALGQAQKKAAAADRQWWQDDPVASAIIQAYVDVHSREHITSLGLMVPGNERDSAVSVLDIREQMAKHGDSFSRDTVDNTLRKLFRGDGFGTSFGTVFPQGFRARGKDPLAYRKAGYRAGGEEKSFVILTKARNLPKPRS